MHLSMAGYIPQFPCFKIQEDEVFNNRKRLHINTALVKKLSTRKNYKQKLSQMLEKQKKTL